MLMVRPRAPLQAGRGASEGLLGDRRRMQEQGPVHLAQAQPFQLGQLRVTPATRQVEGAWAGTLEPRVMQVLVVLAAARGAVVGREDLITRCWDGRIVGEGSIHRVISLLRDLGAESGAFTVETVRKVGYRLIEAEAGGVVDAEAPVPPGAVASSARRRWIAAGGVAAVLVAVAAVWLATHPARAVGRVEVGRFELRQHDPDLQRLAPAAADAVVAAEFEITGALDRDGGDIAVDLQVQERRSGLALASMHFRRPAADGEGLVEQAADSLAATLTCALADRRQSRQPMSEQVFALYVNTCDAIAHEGNSQRMLDAAHRLVAAAPDLAIGQALLAVAQANLSVEMEAGSAEAEALRAAARATAERALRLDPRTPKAWIAIANSYPAASAFATREQALLKAREIDPALNPGRLSYIGLLQEEGRLREAYEVSERLVAANDPRIGAGALRELAISEAEIDDLVHARAHLDQLRRIDPRAADGADWLVATFWDDPASGLERLRRLSPSGNFNPHSYACMAQYLAELPGRQARRAKGLPRACENAPPGRRLALLAREGDIDGAYAESAVLQGDSLMVGMLFSAPFRAFRADPRFLPLAARLGLLDYWRQSGHWPDFCLAQDRPYDCRAAGGHA